MMFGMQRIRISSAFWFLLVFNVIINLAAWAKTSELLKTFDSVSNSSEWVVDRTLCMSHTFENESQHVPNSNLACVGSLNAFTSAGTPAEKGTSQSHSANLNLFKVSASRAKFLKDNELKLRVITKAYIKRTEALGITNTFLKNVMIRTDHLLIPPPRLTT